MAEDTDVSTETVETAATTTTATEPRTFTQDELDRIVNERVNKSRAQFKDYGDLRTRAQQFDELQAANQTESERLRARIERAEQKAEQAEARALAESERAQRSVVRAAVVREAARANAADADDVFALMDHTLVSIDEDGNPVGVDRAVQSLLESKPHLVRRGSGGFDGGARGTAPVGADFNDELRGAFGIAAR